MSLETRAYKLLIVDDEEFVREAIELYFVTEGFHVFTASGGQEALETIERETIDLAVLDILMPGMDGIQLLRSIKKHDPNIEVVMASGCGTIESAIESMRLGAYDYVTKPILNFDEDLLKVVRKALERRSLLTANQKLTGDLKEINREIKNSNAVLKKHVAELEVLYETGRMLTELQGIESLLDLTMQTLQHNFQIPEAVVFLQEGEQWRVKRATHLAATEEGPTLQSSALLLPEELEPGAPFEPGSELSDLLQQLQVPEGQSEHPVVLPLRTGGRCIGVILGFPVRSDLAESTIQRLHILTTLVAAPLALHSQGTGVAQ